MSFGKILRIKFNTKSKELKNHGVLMNLANLRK